MSNPQEHPQASPGFEAPRLLPRLELPPLALNLAASPRFGQAEQAPPISFIEPKPAPAMTATIETSPPPPPLVHEPAPAPEPIPQVDPEPVPVAHAETMQFPEQPATLGGIFSMPVVADAAANPDHWYDQSQATADAAAPFAGIEPSEFAQPVPVPQPDMHQAPVVDIEEFDRPRVVATHPAPTVVKVGRSDRNRRRPMIIAAVFIAIPTLFIATRLDELASFASLMNSAL